MNTTYPTYTELIDQLVEAFGTTPGQQLQTELANLYQRHPAVTLAKAREATNAHTAGRIHSPWGFLQAELRRHDQTREQKPQTPDHDREHATKLAERWLHNAGLYCPNAQEAELELFDAHPTTPPSATACLAPWSDDPTLRTHIRTEWERHQPRATEADRQKSERAEAWKRTHPNGTTYAHKPPPPQPAHGDDIPL